MHTRHYTPRSGFTLIELSIVLVIIGLIVGGVLVGRDLISSAAVRAQIAQIEKLQTAKNTFYGKYGFLPGDVPAPVDSKFGISVGNTGLCNGNGIIDFGAYGGNNGMTGENNMFFINLGETRLIDGTFSFADVNMDASSSRIGNYILPAKIGGGKFIYVWSGGPGSVDMSTGTDSQSYMTLSGVSRVCGYNPCGVWPYTSTTSPTLLVSEAYKIDTKMDDGLPQGGQVRAFYLARSASTIVGTWSTNAAADSATTCFNTGSGTYSIGYNNGGGGNCALSFKFQ